PRSRARTRRTTVLGVLASVALVAVAGAAAWITFSGSSADGAAQGPTGHDITSQRTDPAPLSVSEVFPGGTVTPQPGRAYALVRSQAAADCASAVVGNLADLLKQAGCTQVVRATLTSPDQVYVVTAGVFNLTDEAAAQQVAGGIQASVSATKGRLSGYAAGGASDVFAHAPTRLGWDTRGHFLLFCVVARADGTAIASDATIRPILDDLVEKYLKGTVLKARAAVSASATAK
ncbi:MAG TPA: hypothetical protein VJT31_31805, partial [Rugosimonospora sp.]|nr:hypothetical protein [Rugosimonospora sp.]